MARYKKEINWERVELYVKAGCSQARIAKSMFLDEDTLRSRCKEKYGIDWSVFSAALQSEGEILIEAKQFDKAMKGYWPALQWLGKVKLGQKEPENVASTPLNQPHIDQAHENMILQAENQDLKEKINAYKPEAE